MLSPAAQQRAAFARTEVLKVEVKAEPDVLVAKFRLDLARIKNLKSRQRRTQSKQSFLPDYQAWLDQKLLQIEPLPANEAAMFAWLLIWQVDTGNFLRALELLAFALERDIQAPREFERSLIELATEEISLDLLQREQCAPQAALLAQLAELVVGQDMADPIQAKLYKAQGLAYFTAQPDKAITYFQQAQALSGSIGVKRYLSQLTRPNRPQQAKQQLAAYQLSAWAAAQLMGVSTPTIIRRAKRHPEWLPHLALKMGTRTVYRFNPLDIKRYLKQQMISTPNKD